MTRKEWGRRLCIAVAGMIILQGARMLLSFLMFRLVERTMLWDKLFETVYMLAASGIMLCLAKRRQWRLELLPLRFGKGYWLATIGTAAFLAVTPLITKSWSVYGLLSLFGGAVAVPFFEEIVFRGWMWRLFSPGGDRAAYLISTLLFGLWHMGYADVVLWHIAQTGGDFNFLKMAVWKVSFGLAFGTIFGWVRRRKGNVYSSMLLHCVLNTFGS